MFFVKIFANLKLFCNKNATLIAIATLSSAAVYYIFRNSTKKKALLGKSSIGIGKNVNHISENCPNLFSERQNGCSGDNHRLCNPPGKVDEHALYENHGSILAQCVSPSSKHSQCGNQSSKLTSHHSTNSQFTLFNSALGQYTQYDGANSHNTDYESANLNNNYENHISYESVFKNFQFSNSFGSQSNCYKKFGEF